MDLQKELLSLQKPFEAALSELIGYKSQIEAICNSISSELKSSAKVHKLVKQDRELVLNHAIKTFPNQVNPMFVPKFKKEFLQFAETQNAFCDLIGFLHTDEGFPQQDEMTMTTFRANMGIQLTKLSEEKAKEYLLATSEIAQQLKDSLPQHIDNCAKRGLALMQADSGIDASIMSNFDEIVTACDASNRDYLAQLRVITEDDALNPYSKLAACLYINAEILLKETAQFTLLMQMLQFNSLKLSNSSLVAPATAQMPEIPFAKLSK